MSRKSRSSSLVVLSSMAGGMCSPAFAPAALAARPHPPRRRGPSRRARGCRRRPLTQEVIRDGSFASVGALVRDIEAYLAQRNRAPKPYRWKADGQTILRKVQRAREALAAASDNPC